MATERRDHPRECVDYNGTLSYSVAGETASLVRTQHGPERTRRALVVPTVETQGDDLAMGESRYDGRRPAKLASRALEPVVKVYIAMKTDTQHLSASALRINRWWLGRLCGQVKDTADLTVENLSAFFDGLKKQDGKPMSDATRMQAWQTLKAFSRWCVDADILHRDFLKGLKAPKVHPKKFIMPTPQEMSAMLRACGTHKEGIKTHCMLLLLTDTGLRSSELTGLTFRDWDGGSKLTVRGTKTEGSERVVFMADDVVRSLRRYLELRAPAKGPEEFLFATRTGGRISSREMLAKVHRLWARAGNDSARRIHVHTLRHVCGTNLKAAGLPAEDVAKVLGHANVRTTTNFYWHPDEKYIERTQRRAGALGKYLGGENIRPEKQKRKDKPAA